MVLTVITVYIICWLPYWIIQMLLLLLDSSLTRNLGIWRICLIMMTYSLAYANSALNPVLYGFLSDNFKQSFIKALTACNLACCRRASERGRGADFAGPMTDVYTRSQLHGDRNIQLMPLNANTQNELVPLSDEQRKSSSDFEVPPDYEED